MAYAKFCENKTLTKMSEFTVSWHFCIRLFPWESVYYCGCDITPCNKIDKPLVVYRFSGNVMTSIITLRKRWPNFDIFTPKMRFLSNFNAM